jgi:hypothetical protein
MALEAVVQLASNSPNAHIALAWFVRIDHPIERIRGWQSAPGYFGKIIKGDIQVGIALVRDDVGDAAGGLLGSVVAPQHQVEVIVEMDKSLQPCAIVTPSA